VSAAEVAKSTNQFVDLIDFTTCLSVVHRAPESDWPELANRMVAGRWTKEITERYVEVIKSLVVPEDLIDLFPRAILRERFFKTREFSARSLAAVV